MIQMPHKKIMICMTFLLALIHRRSASNLYLFDNVQFGQMHLEADIFRSGYFAENVSLCYNLTACINNLTYAESRFKTNKQDNLIIKLKSLRINNLTYAESRFKTNKRDDPITINNQWK